MKILHITPSSNGYEVVELLANRFSKRNHFSVIRKNEKILMSGGFLINDTPEIRKILDNIPKKDQYEFVKSFKVDPFAKLYYDEYEQNNY